MAPKRSTDDEPNEHLNDSIIEKKSENDIHFKEKSETEIHIKKKSEKQIHEIQKRSPNSPFTHRKLLPVVAGIDSLVCLLFQINKY